MNDPSGDVNEPDRYYPNDYHQFVRIVPPDSVQAKALLEVMQSDGCHYSVMIDDNTPYGEALASNILAEKRRVRFAVSDSVGPLERYGRLLRRARHEHPDCFVYCGNRNANTVEMFEKFARFVPRLYGTDALVDQSFYDADERGLRPAVARRVTLMVPPYKRNNAYRRFEDHFREIYHKTPDAYVAYAYEAMRLALQAIAESGSGKREDIVTKLKSATRAAEGSVLGEYRITTTGDTDVEDYAVSRIKDNRLRPRGRGR
jgi:ABC-type branched-subunit amino acid transport system substrate-binding protein